MGMNIRLAFILLWCACPWLAWAQSAQLADLRPVELEYHTKIFDYALDYTETGKSYEWKSYGGSGKITPGAPFISKSKYNCREFSEYFTVAGLDGKREAIACKRIGNDGWCVLKPTDALTCAMEKTPGVLDGSLPQASVDTPSVNVGGIGPVGSPNVNVNNDVNTNANIDAPKHADKPGQPIADTVTGTAGRTAGPATGGAIKWFGETFR